MGLLTLSTKEADVTFNAWWTQLGRTAENVQRALDRTRKQIGGMMPPGYVPPPLRPAPGPAPSGAVASFVPRSFSESLDVDRMSEAELRHEAAALRSQLDGPVTAKGALRGQLGRIQARLEALEPPSLFQEAATLAFAEGGQSIAVAPSRSRPTRASTSPR
jgi:hypothetical protein